MTKWEYAVDVIDSDDPTVPAVRGELGWELVTVLRKDGWSSDNYEQPDIYTYFFKRKKLNEDQ